MGGGVGASTGADAGGQSQPAKRLHERKRLKTPSLSHSLPLSLSLFYTQKRRAIAEFVLRKKDERKERHRTRKRENDGKKERKKGKKEKMTGEYEENKKTNK